MIKIFATTLLLSLSGMSGTSFAQDIDTTLNVCAEDSGWPPFSIPANSKKQMFTGLNKEWLEAIFNKHHIKFNIVIKPWKRCLYEAINGDIHIVLDAADNEQRRKDYLLAGPIYHLTPIFFYAKALRDKIPTINVGSDLESFGTLCGQSGYTYLNFGVSNDIVKMDSKDLSGVIDLVSKQRCTFGLARKETFLAQYNYQANKDEIQYSEIPNSINENFYWLINKKYKFAEKLKNIVNKEISLLNSNNSNR